MKYTEEVRRFIRDNVEGATVKELAEKVNGKFGTAFTESSMKSYKKNHNLRSGTRRGNPKGHSNIFPKEVQDFIRENVSGLGNRELTDLVNDKFGTSYTENQLKSYKKNHKLNSGLDCRFPKGNVPYNKGKHIGGWEPTQFRKGHIPVNHRPVGTESVRGHRERDERYVWVKVAEPNKWRLKHILEYEKHNGPVPDGKVVIFLDGDTMNTEIGNLMAIDRAVHARMNRMGLRFRDREHTISGIHVAELAVKAAEAGRRVKSG